MTTPGFQRLKALFDDLAGLSPERRRERLAGTADLDLAAREQLERWLDAHDRLGDATLRGVSLTAFDAAQHLGGRLGPWRIERELGRGGMGNVYLASRDDDLEQQVAIKIVRPEMLDKHTLARFRLECQVLALLRHPNIAAMLDVGELDDGSPYVVMEYVEGVPFTAHAAGLDLRRRLALFLLVCNAVACAHRNMIVHRDIKPGNVLVDTRGNPKLLDFGIAKPLIARIGAIDVEHTVTAQQFFSIHSAAPEQLRGGAITVACDVYGLGALLYELLAGRPALSFAGLTAAQAEARILDEEPAPPSNVVPLDADLDAIVLRCLRKQPEQRYASVEQLVDDVERYLSKRPVLARRGQWLYRAERFVARHRLALAMSAVLAAVLLASGYALWRQYRTVIGERNRAESLVALIVGAVEAADQGKRGGKDVSVRELVEQISSQAVRDLQQQPNELARVVETLVNAQLSLNNIDDAVATMRASERVVAAAKAGDPRLSDRLDLLEGRLQVENDDTAGARRILDALSTRLVDPADHLAWAMLDTRVLQSEGKPRLALAHMQEASTRWTASVDTAARWKAEQRLAELFSANGEQARAIALFESQLAEQRAATPSDQPAIVDLLAWIAKSRANAGDVEGSRATIGEAVDFARRVYGTDSTIYAAAINVQGIMLIGQGEIDAGAALAQESLRIEAGHGRRHGKMRIGSYNTAAILAEVPKYRALAEAHFERAAKSGQADYPAGHPTRLFLMGVPGAFFARIGRYDDAIALLDALVAESTDATRRLEMYAFIRLNAAFAHYGKNPTTEARALLLRDIDAGAAAEPGLDMQRGLALLRASVEAVGAR